MGFKKWFKRATKVPKSIRKLKVGNVLKGVGVGLVTGGPVGAVLGGAAGVKGDIDRQKDERAAAGQAQQIPIGMDAETAAVIESAAAKPAMPSVPGSSAMPIALVVGLLAVVVALVAMRRK